jgi:hypothetical protein
MVAPINIESAGSQQTRLAVEDQYGVMPAVPVWNRMSDMRAVPKPQFATEAVFGAGDEVPSGMLVNDEFTNVDIVGRAGYSGIMNVLASLFGFPTSTLVLGSTYDHVWTWNGRTPIIPASYAMHYGLPGSAKQVLGFIFNSLGLTVNRGGYGMTTGGFGKATELGAAMGGATNEVQTLTVTGTPTAFAPRLGFRGRFNALASAATFTAAAIQALLESIPTIGPGGVLCAGGPLPTTPITVTFLRKLGGQDVPTLLTTGTTFTGGSSPTFAVAVTTPGADTATAITNIPIAPLHFDIYSGDSWAEIQAESTKLLALYNVDFAFADKWQRAMPINSAKTSDGIYAGDAPEHTVGLRFGVDAEAESRFTNIRQGTKKYMRLHAIGGATGDSTHKYELVIDLALLVQASDGYDSENGIHVITWGNRIARDEVLDNSFAIRLRNKRSGL